VYGRDDEGASCDGATLGWLGFDVGYKAGLGNGA